MRKTVHARVLERTAASLGGPDKLALYLKLPPVHIKVWLQDAAPVPPNVFLACVDYLLDRHLEHVSGHDGRGGSAPRDS